jgi:hypothetical protein
MAKKKKETTPKPRAEKYEEKVAVDGTFEDMIKASFLGKPKETKKSGK